MSAPRRRGNGSGRGAVVYAAWCRWWLDDVRRRLDGEPGLAPPSAEMEGLTADEREFVIGLIAGRIPGSVIGAIDERFGPWDRDTGAGPDDSFGSGGTVVDFGDAARRRRGAP